MPNPPARLLRRVARVATCVAVLASMAALAVGSSWGDTRSAGEPRLVAAQHQRAAAHFRAARQLARAAERVAAARGDGTCAKTASLPGQGATCRTADGLYVLPGVANGTVTTHGPDLVDPSDAAVVLAGRATSRAALTGSRANAICSSPARTRHVALVYLLPSD
ncbi:MAG: hypothetical protein H7287_11675, partial [Thermoleophilia bacterium]|nr:hypothetical protein [Thermoleophilia bacterium]